MSNLTIVDIGYCSTHFWVISAGTSRRLVDLGWSGRWGELAAAAEERGDNSQRGRPVRWALWSAAVDF